jgi:RsiW-degrading membrane proteinase PrsW (M82 family)
VTTRRSIWVAQPLAIAALIVYVLAVAALAPALQETARSAPVMIGLVLAVTPALLWFALFYAQDHREPEPLSYVLRVAVAGAVLAGGLAMPVMRRASLSTVLAAADPLAALAIAVLFVGALQQLCVYLAVRYLVFDADEFDEVTDGFVYGTAAALGLATTFNLGLVLQDGGIDPLPASLTVVVTALALAASGGVLGYFVGRAKLREERFATAVGLLISAALNGLVAYALREVSYAGLAYRPWNGLVVAAAVAGAVTLVLFRRVATADGAAMDGEPLAAAGAPVHPVRAGSQPWFWMALTAMLMVGWALAGAVEARTVSFADPQGGLRLRYPAGWFAVPGSTNLLDVQDPLSGAPVPTGLIVTREPRPADRTIDQIVRDGVLSQVERLAMYRVLRERSMRVAGQEAIAVEYAFVADPHDTALGAERVPVVMWGKEVVVPAGGVVYRVDVRAASHQAARARALLARVLRTVQF